MISFPGTVAKIFLCFLILPSSILPTSAAILKGRIEQIFGQEEITMPVLKRLEPQMDTAKGPVQSARVIRSELKSFPMILRGEWSGQLRVTQIDYTDAYKRALPVEAQVEEQFFQIGKSADAKFRFFADRKSITMAPPVVVFPVSQQESTIFTKQGVKGLFLATDDTSGQEFRSNSGEHLFTGKSLKNIVTQLAPTVVEQNTVVLASLVHEKSRQKSAYFAEHVFRFEKRAGFQMHVQVVEANFGPDGRLWKRMLLEGDLR